MTPHEARVGVRNVRCGACVYAVSGAGTRFGCGVNRYQPHAQVRAACSYAHLVRPSQPLN